MGIADWDAWMKEHNIYIPTVEEIQKVQEQNLVKVNRIHREHEMANKRLEKLRERASKKKRKTGMRPTQKYSAYTYEEYKRRFEEACNRT